MTILNLPYDLYLNISSYLIKSDMCGFMNANKKTRSLLIWNYDDVGVHICMSCDLTSSMRYVYDNLKIHLLHTLKDLKQSSTTGRVLSSACFYWDLDRCVEHGEPYVQIQPPAESIFKQEKLISNAIIDNGGGPECGGIALCELESLFRNRWISQHVGNFSQSLDVALICLDAPFHFIEDTESYYEVTRRHSIQTDWISAIHKLCKKGVLIIMVLINTQSIFKHSLRLIGGFNQALGGISIEVEPDSLSQLPLFIKSIIAEETRKRKIVQSVYKKIAYQYKYLKDDKLSDIMNSELKCIDDVIHCANIPESILVKSENVPNAVELAQCETMAEAVSNGLLESEAVTKRLYFIKKGRPMYVACTQSHMPYAPLVDTIPSDVDIYNDFHSIPVLPPSLYLSRQQSECISVSQQPSGKLKYANMMNSQIGPLHTMRKQNSMPIMKPDEVKRELTFCKLLGSGFDKPVETFGLLRNKSLEQSVYMSPRLQLGDVNIQMLQPISEETEEKNNIQSLEDRFCIIEGSVKCYLKNPNIDLGVISSPLINLINKSGEKYENEFRKLLHQQSPKQYELYMQGGLFSRFAKKKPSTYSTDHELQNLQSSDKLIGDIPTLQRTFSDTYNHTSTERISKFIRSHSLT